MHKYINLQTKEILNNEIINTLSNNAMLRVNTELWEIWDFNKNNLDIYKVKRGSDKIAWWYCSKCDITYDMKIQLKDRGQGCPYCVGKRFTKSNSLAIKRPDLLSIWSEKNEINPYEVSTGVATKVFWDCDKCNDTYPMSINKKVSGRGCSICSGYYTTIKNSLGGIYPEISKSWHKYKNGNLTPYDVSKASGKKVWWNCLDCDTDYEMTIDKRTSKTAQVNYCPVCSSNLSFGEKVIYELLSSNNISFKKEATFKWSGKKRYDFYINEYSCIIEIHGEQHYNGSFSRIGGRTLLEEIANDNLKERLAKDNGVENYIIIKSNSYNMEVLKKEILISGLLNILNINENSLNTLNKLTLTNPITKSWELYKHDTNISNIASELQLNKKTISKYIKLGKSLNKIV